jgi:hypothetical protein
MRKLTGLCFLTAILFASSANAQSMFIDQGDPSAISVTAGGAFGSSLYGGGLNLAYSYRGVFDVGIDASFSRFKSGRYNNLNAFDFAPFINWQILRTDADETPISVTALFAFEKVLYGNNGPVSPPDGWGLVLGATVYRKFEFGTSMLFIPEVVAAYDFMYTRFYSNALDQNAPTVGDSSAIGSPPSESKHSARGIVKANLGFKSGENVLTVTPYAGYQGFFGTVAGLTVGYVF